MAAPRLEPAQCQAVHEAADAAAVAAAHTVVPWTRTIPPRDGRPARIMSSDELTNGWATVTVSPAGSRVARWLLAEFADPAPDAPNRARGPRSYRPGVTLSIRTDGPDGQRFHRSTDRLHAAAGAYAAVLRDHGIVAASDWNDGMN